MTLGSVIALIKSLGGGGGGGGASVFVVHVTYDDDTGVFTCDKTAGEMWQAARNGVVLFYEDYEDEEDYAVRICMISNNNESGYQFVDPNGAAFEAATADDYPATSGGSPS